MLSIEGYHPGWERWVQIGEIKPGEPQGSLTNIKPDGTREMYLFACTSDGSKSTIYRSGFGLDVEVSQNMRAVISDPSRLELIKELGLGESFEMEVKTEQNPEPRRIRFTPPINIFYYY